MLAFSASSWICVIQYNGTWPGVLSLLTKGGALFFFYLSGCCSEWMVFLLYWDPQFWVPMVIGPRMWFFLTASSVSLWWLLYVLESLCKANCHSVSAVTSLILLIMCSTEEYAEPDNLIKLVEGHVHLHYRMKGTKTGIIWHVWASVWGCTCVLWWVCKRYRENT